MFNPLIAAMIRNSGQSWWQARFSDGRIISEWDTTTKGIKWGLGIAGTSRWEEIPKEGMIGLRLLCPNGMAGELEAPEGFKFFQLKVGYFDVAIGGGHGGHSVAAHIIGVVQNPAGECLCRAWDYRTKQLLRFRDNVYNMKFEHIGKLSLEVQGLKV